MVTSEADEFGSIAMCNDCVKETYPERDSTCLESGAYLMNYAACANCGARGLEIKNRVQSEEDDEELVTFQHICSECSHVVANHEYSFRVNEAFQEYEMSCLLCGNGEDQRSIMPYDPRGPQS